MTKEEIEEIKILVQGLGAITMFDETAKRVDKAIIFLDNELSKLHQPIAISTACDCENKVYDPLMSGEVKCLRCSKMIAQTDL